MWVFTVRGFFSIIKYDDNKSFVVRSRVKGDIEAVWPNARVHHLPERDYAFRALVPRWEVADAIDLAIQNIDYTNFKQAAFAVDHRRSEYYGMVWAILADMQDALEPKTKPT